MDANNTPPASQNQPIDKYASVKNMGVASLVLGVLALLCNFTGIGAIIGIVLAIIGFVLGKKAKNILPPEMSGLATAGWICSLVAICICVVTTIISIAVLGGLAVFFGR